jgi:sulfotransferase
MEKLYRKEIKNINSPMETGPQLQTLEGRLNTWTAQDGLVGGTFNSIRDAVTRGHGHKFHFIDFEKITTQPEMTLRHIYEFLNEEYFDHDFNNVAQYTKENDAEHGFTDLHTIRPQIAPVADDSKEILGYMHEQFQNFHFNF